jgi:peptide/nickel transport system permease protein
LIILIIVMSLVGPGMLQIIVILGTYSGIQNSRVIRSAVIGIKENTYILAAVAIGCKPSRILLNHILVNIVPPIIIVFSTTIGWVILAEAFLSFLGFGLPPDIPSWGGMLSNEGRRYMERSPGLAFWPGFFLALVVFCLNMFGDTLRDLLDPRLKGGQGSYGAHKKKLKAALAK